MGNDWQTPGKTSPFSPVGERDEAKPFKQMWAQELSFGNRAKARLYLIVATRVNEGTLSVQDAHATAKGIAEGTITTREQIPKASTEIGEDE